MNPYSLGRATQQVLRRSSKLIEKRLWCGQPSMDENDLLYWSDELQTWFVDNEMQASIPDDCLFRVDRFSKEF